MKKILTAILCLFCVTAYAQQRIMFTNGTNVWYYYGTGTTNSTTNMWTYLGDTMTISNLTVNGIASRSNTNDLYQPGEYATMDHGDERLLAMAMEIWYGTTNAHPVLTGKGAMETVDPAVEWRQTNTLVTGVNTVGVWSATNLISRDTVRMGAYLGHFHALITGAGNPVIKNFLRLAAITSDGATTNILDTSDMINVSAATTLSDFELRCHISTNTGVAANSYLSVIMCVERTGGASASEVIVGGGGRGTSLRTPNFSNYSTPILPDWVVSTNETSDLTFSNLTLNGIGVVGNQGIRSTGNVCASNSYFLLYSDNLVNNFQFDHYSLAYEPQISFRRALGNMTSPTNPAAAYILGSIAGRGWTNTAFTGSKAKVAMHSAATWDGTNTPSYISFQVVPAGSVTLGAAAYIQSDNSLLLFNGTWPATGAGYGLLFASTNEIWTADGSGNYTKLSAENDANEMVRLTVKPFKGVTEEYNITQAGLRDEELAACATVEDMLKVHQKYKGKVYKATPIPVQDWRANEDRQAAERQKQIDGWTTNNETAKPEPYVKRPVPAWCVDVQKQFDGKYK